MFIQNAVLKSINAEGLSFPLAEGSVVSAGGVTGIVPTTLNVRPATNRIYVAVAGTVDLTSDANKSVTFTEEQIKALGGDFNFVPAVEGGGGLPDMAGKAGKVLTVNNSGSAEWSGAVLPEAAGYEMGKVLTVGLNGNWEKYGPPAYTQFVEFEQGEGGLWYSSVGGPQSVDSDKPIVFKIYNEDANYFCFSSVYVRGLNETTQLPFYIIDFNLATGINTFSVIQVEWFCEGDNEAIQISYYE